MKYQEVNLEDYRHLYCARCKQNDKWVDDDIVNIENGQVWCTHCDQNTVLIEEVEQ